MFYQFYMLYNSIYIPYDEKLFMIKYDWFTDLMSLMGFVVVLKNLLL